MGKRIKVQMFYIINLLHKINKKKYIKPYMNSLLNCKLYNIRFKYHFDTCKMLYLPFLYKLYKWLKKSNFTTF